MRFHYVMLSFHIDQVVKVKFQIMCLGYMATSIDFLSCAASGQADFQSLGLFVYFPIINSACAKYCGNNVEQGSFCKEFSQRLLYRLKQNKEGSQSTTYNPKRLLFFP